MTMQDVSYIIAQAATVAITASAAKAFSSFDGIEDALGFYGVYHSDPMNQLIHFFGVPFIAWSMLIFLSMLPIPFLENIKLPTWAGSRLTWAAPFLLLYVGFYVKMDPVGGGLYSPILYFMYLTSAYWVTNDQRKARLASKHSKSKPAWYGTGTLLKLALFFHLGSWYVQIHPGHMIFEGARPAVLDSIGGAITSAPLFAFNEGLWYFGLHKDLQQATLAKVAENLARICAEGSVHLRACGSL